MAIPMEIGMAGIKASRVQTHPLEPEWYVYHPGMSMQV